MQSAESKLIGRFEGTALPRSSAHRQEHSIPGQYLQWRAPSQLDCDQRIFHSATVSFVMSRATCKTNRDRFCYVCAEVMLLCDRRTITGLVKQNYRDCFGFSMQNEDTSHSPSFICYNCYKRLRDSKKRPCSKFAVPALWRQPLDHSTDCYFCLTKTYGFNRKNKKKIKYPDVVSVSKPVLLSRLLQEDHNIDMNADVSSLEENSLNTTSSMELKPSLFTQRSCKRSESLKRAAELLGSRLNHRHVMQESKGCSTS